MAPAEFTKPQLKAKDLMTSPVITVRPETPVREVSRLMLQHRISGLPVVGEDERIVGIITESDLLQKASGPSPLERLAFLRPEQAQELEQHLRRYEAKVASEMMTRPVVTAEETTSLRELARLMADRRINRVPIAREGHVVGIVTRHDILKAFARSDEVLQQVVQNLFEFDLAGVDARRVEARVRRGIVHITGWVKTRLEAEALTSVMRSIDGVVDVDNSNLAWEKDNRLRPGRR
jgi:CBS domain-containing protein